MSFHSRVNFKMLYFMSYFSMTIDEPFKVILGHFKVHFIILLSGLLLGLCPDWQDWSGDGPTNAKKAMDMAEDYLGVPKV